MRKHYLENLDAHLLIGVSIHFLDVQQIFCKHYMIIIAQKVEKSHSLVNLNQPIEPTDTIQRIARNSPRYNRETIYFHGKYYKSIPRIAKP